MRLLILLGFIIQEQIWHIATCRHLTCLGWIWLLLWGRWQFFTAHKCRAWHLIRYLGNKFVVEKIDVLKLISHSSSCLWTFFRASLLFLLLSVFYWEQVEFHLLCPWETSVDHVVEWKLQIRHMQSRQRLRSGSSQPIIWVWPFISRRPVKSPVEHAFSWLITENTQSGVLRINLFVVLRSNFRWGHKSVVFLRLIWRSCSHIVLPALSHVWNLCLVISQSNWVETTHILGAPR